MVFLFSTDVAAKRRHLKITAVPSLNLPNVQNAVANRYKEERTLKRNGKTIKSKDKLQQDGPASLIHEEALLERTHHVPEVTMITASNEQSTSSCCGSCQSRSTQDFAVQVVTVFLKHSFINFLKTDAQLSTFNGIESFAISNTIVEIVTKKIGDELEHHNAKISIYDKVLMTYIKLKQNMTYSSLTVLFDDCSANTCQRVFFEMIKILSVCLKSIIKWPSRETISKNISVCFEGFGDVRVVIDCTEIFIQQPKNLCCQLITYSTYKKGQTCKFMTGITPAGNISYVSRAYGGRISDKAIFNDCDIKKLLQPGDGIMVDKGLTIDNECKANNWILYRPPFLKDKKQFSKSEAILTARIAKARVHIERSNQRIKNFRIMGETMSSNLMPIIEDIFIIICATVNLGSPILKDDKFMKK